MPLPTFSTLGAGPLVLLLHGSGGGFRSFAPQVETLASLGWRAVAWDMPGYGYSAPIEPYTFKGLAERCMALIEALVPGGGAVTLVGQGMGGMVAQEVTLRRPDRVGRLVLAATATGGLLVPGDLKVLAKMATPRRFKDPNFMRENMGALYGGLARTDPDLLADFARLSRSPSRRGYLYQQMALAGWVSAPLLPLLRQPTLVLAGSDDPLVPLVNARILARLIPHSTLTVLDDGHLFLFTKARESAESVDRFLDSSEH